jgi:hypothetical protein
LTCISSWYICTPNINWIHPTITEKMNGNCPYQECDGRTDGKPDGHRNTIVRPVFNGCIKKRGVTFNSIFKILIYLLTMINFIYMLNRYIPVNLKQDTSVFHICFIFRYLTEIRCWPEHYLLHFMMNGMISFSPSSTSL